MHTMTPKYRPNYSDYVTRGTTRDQRNFSGFVKYFIREWSGLADRSEAEVQNFWTKVVARNET